MVITALLPIHRQSIVQTFPTVGYTNVNRLGVAG